MGIFAACPGVEVEVEWGGGRCLVCSGFLLSFVRRTVSALEKLLLYQDRFRVGSIAKN